MGTFADLYYVRIDRKQRERVLDLLDEAYIPGEEFRGCWKKYSVKVSWMAPWCGIKSRIVRNDMEFTERIVKKVSQELHAVTVGQIIHDSEVIWMVGCEEGEVKFRYDNGGGLHMEGEEWLFDLAKKKDKKEMSKILRGEYLNEVFRAVALGEVMGWPTKRLV